MSVVANTSDDGNTLIVKISGKFDISLSKTFGDSYENKIHSVSKVVLDMADVQHIDSSGLGMMLMLRERFGEDKEKIEIVNAGSNVAKIFELTGYGRLFNIELND